MSDLLDMAIDAHGGLELWRGLKRITVDKTIGGTLFQLKGQDTLAATRFAIDPHRPHAIYTPEEIAIRVVYNGDAEVSVETGAGRVLERRPSPRAVFDGMAREYPWDLLHLAYFCGYAGWNYLTTPFLFTYPGFETEEIEPWEEEGEIWRRLKVRFSPDIPTHCPEQIFHFDAKGLLRRLDYHSEVVNSVRTAHYLYDHANFSGLVMPTRRKALPRLPDGRSAPGPVFVDLGYSNFRLE